MDAIVALNAPDSFTLQDIAKVGTNYRIVVDNKADSFARLHLLPADCNYVVDKSLIWKIRLSPELRFKPRTNCSQWLYLLRNIHLTQAPTSK